MCGRYTLKATAAELADVFELVSVPAVAPRWNLTPSQQGLIVRSGQPRVATQAQWGFRHGAGAGPIPVNARSETVAQKPLFRAAVATQRALVLADGYYEWRRTPDGASTHKQPFYISAPGGRPFAMAGIWASAAVGDDGAMVDTFCVLTTTPNALLATIHDRMPVLLGRKGAALWLDEAPTAQQARLDILRPCPTDWLQAWPVSALVNSPRNDAPACCAQAPLTPPPQGSLLGFDGR